MPSMSSVWLSKILDALGGACRLVVVCLCHIFFRCRRLWNAVRGIWSERVGIVECMRRADMFTEPPVARGCFIIVCEVRGLCCVLSCVRLRMCNTVLASRSSAHIGGSQPRITADIGGMLPSIIIIRPCRGLGRLITSNLADKVPCVLHIHAALVARISLATLTTFGVTI